MNSKASEKNSGGIFDLDKKKKRLEEVNLASENPTIWEKPDEMQKLNKEKSILVRAIEEWELYDKKLKDAKVLLEMSEEAQDEPTFQEAKSEVSQIENLGKDLELKRVLNGELDANSTYLSINSGAGGTESCDWAEMLLRMYLKYCDKQGFKYEMIDRNDGEESPNRTARS